MSDSKSTEQPAPKYCIGHIVAGTYYAGTILNAFFAEGEWNYGVGENASTELTGLDKATGYRIGPKYIRESDIKWKQDTLHDEWRRV